jgi:hypothetical protein
MLSDPPVVGAYAVEFKPRKYRVWCEKKDLRTKEVEMIPMWKEELAFNLHHSSGDSVTFKYHRHQGKWIWSDSRRSGSIPEHDVVAELARMLFHGSEEAATTYVRMCLVSQGL